MKATRYEAIIQTYFLFFCFTFRTLSPIERQQVVHGKTACFVCLKIGHRAEVCASTRSCQICSQRHNTLRRIHDNPSSEQEVRGRAHAPFLCAPIISTTKNQVLLATAIGNVCNGKC